MRHLVDSFSACIWIGEQTSPKIGIEPGLVGVAAVHTLPHGHACTKPNPDAWLTFKSYRQCKISAPFSLYRSPKTSIDFSEDVPFASVLNSFFGSRKFDGQQLMHYSLSLIKEKFAAREVAAWLQSRSDCKSPH